MTQSFRLLTELYSFLYLNLIMFPTLHQIIKFPSPYGVIFILIITNKHSINLYHHEFPSPYGVIFILIIKEHGYDSPNDFCVSVSLRSYIHSYVLFTIVHLMGVTAEVSVSLRSYIHSYAYQRSNREGIYLPISFRLLTELYSFLYEEKARKRRAGGDI